MFLSFSLITTLLLSTVASAFQITPSMLNAMKHAQTIAEQTAKQSLKQPGLYARLATGSGILTGVLVGAVAVGSIAAGPAGELWAASANVWKRELAPYQRPRAFYIHIDGEKILTPPLRIFHIATYLRDYLGISDALSGFPLDVINTYKLLQNYPNGIYGSPLLKKQYRHFCNYLVDQMGMDLSTAKGRLRKRQLVLEQMHKNPSPWPFTYEKTTTIEATPPRLPVIKKEKKTILVSALDIAAFVAYHEYFHRNVSRKEFLKSYLFLVNWTKGLGDKTPDPLSDPLQRVLLGQLKERFIAFQEKQQSLVKQSSETLIRAASSASRMQQQVYKGQAPRDIERVDDGHVQGMEPHVHFKDGTSLTQSGKIHDAFNGTPSPSKRARTWLRHHGWADSVK